MLYGQNLYKKVRERYDVKMYRIENAIYARMLTTTRMTRGMKMLTVKTVSARLTLCLMRSENEFYCSTSSV